jgi:hypothetical protein
MSNSHALAPGPDSAHRATLTHFVVRTRANTRAKG